MDPAEAREFLADAETAHMAFSAPDGAPVIRTLHPVMIGDAVAFHGSPVGEKRLASGSEVVLSAEEIVARIPSYFVHPERACPATTYYRAVQLHGRVADVTDPQRKAQILQALMEKYQPEGGYVPLQPDHPHYRAAIAGLWIFEVPLAGLTGKAKLGQNRTPEELRAVLAALWQRGHAGDDRAIELVRRATRALAPAILQGPEDSTLHAWLGPEDAAAAADLLADTYWNQGVSRETLVRAHQNASAWVGARDAAGNLIGSARATSDRAKYAWIYDVVVAAPWRGRGVGKALVRLLLDHPAVRGARTVLLGTRDAQGLYARFGFVDRKDLPPRPWRTTEMALVRHEEAAHGKMSVLA